METSVQDGVSETVLRVRSVLGLQVQARDGSALWRYQEDVAPAIRAPVLDEAEDEPRVVVELGWR
jgi:hypothetical protein